MNFDWKVYLQTSTQMTGNSKYNTTLNFRVTGYDDVLWWALSDVEPAMNLRGLLLEASLFRLLILPDC